MFFEQYSFSYPFSTLSIWLQAFDRSFDEVRRHFPSIFLDNGLDKMHLSMKMVSNSFDHVDLACCHNLSMSVTYIKAHHIRSVWGITAVVCVCVCLEG